MKYYISFIIVCLSFHCANVKKQNTNGWIPLFNGKSLKHWQAGENSNTFKVENGLIVVHGPRAHLFYNGPVMNHNFKDFELKVEVMTTPGSNSGIFFHTAYQESGWPEKGYEAQVNNTQSDWRRTGSLYGIQDVKETYVNDNEWFTEYIKVEGKKVTIKINDKTVVEYTEPEGIENEKGREKKRLSSGTFALQGHDPESKVYYRQIWVKPL